MPTAKKSTKVKKEVPEHPKEVKNALDVLSKHVASHLAANGKVAKGGIHIRVGFKSKKDSRVTPLFAQQCPPDPSHPGQFICH